MRGHFELYRADCLKQGPGAGSWRWRFIDREGTKRAVSAEGFESAEQARADVGEFVIDIRTATYGQRFPADIAKAVLDS